MIGSGLFVLPGPASKELGPLVFIPYLLASILFIPALLCTCELATAMPRRVGFSITLTGPWGQGGHAWWHRLLVLDSSKDGLGVAWPCNVLHTYGPYMPVYQIKMIAIGACASSWSLTAPYRGRRQDPAVHGTWAPGTIRPLYYIRFVLLQTLQFDTERQCLGPAHIDTTGLVFVSFSGLTWITDMGGEVKNPSRNLPRGLILSWRV